MKILFSGEGGQGVQVMAEILARAAFSEGKHSLYIPNFGVEQRGGVSLAFITIDNQPVVYPKFEIADYVAILSNRCCPRINCHIGKNTRVVRGPAVTQGIKTNLPSRTWNILVLGKINQVAKLVKTESLIRAMDGRFSRQFKKNPELRKLDIKTLKNA